MSHDVAELHNICRSSDFEKVRSGRPSVCMLCLLKNIFRCIFQNQKMNAIFFLLCSKFISSRKSRSTRLQTIRGQTFPSRFLKTLNGRDFYPLARSKETTLERPDFTLQLLMFVTAEKEREMFSIFFLLPFLSAVSCCPRDFKLEQAELAQTMKAQTNRPGSQLFLMQSLLSGEAILIKNEVGRSVTNSWDIFLGRHSCHMLPCHHFD